MIDTFNALREKDTKRAATLGSEGFVNGITRTAFDDLALPNAPNFDDLNTKEQHPWNYVYYCYYLSRKNPMEFTGIDTYVKNCLDNKDQKWLPDKSSLRIQNFLLHGIGTNNGKKKNEKSEEELTMEVLNTVYEGINEMKTELGSLGDRLQTLEDRKDLDFD
jgi:hypothetical protein